MDISSEWRNRHPRPSGTPVKVVALVLILALVVFMILGSGTLADGFTALVSQPSSETE